MRLKARTLEALYALLLLFPFLFTLAVFFLYAFVSSKLAPPAYPA